MKNTQKETTTTQTKWTTMQKIVSSMENFNWLIIGWYWLIVWITTFILWYKIKVLQKTIVNQSDNIRWITADYDGAIERIQELLAETATYLNIKTINESIEKSAIKIDNMKIFRDEDIEALLNELNIKWNTNQK